MGKSRPCEEPSDCRIRYHAVLEKIIVLISHNRNYIRCAMKGKWRTAVRLVLRNAIVVCMYRENQRLTIVYSRCRQDINCNFTLFCRGGERKCTKMCAHVQHAFFFRLVNLCKFRRRRCCWCRRPGDSFLTMLVHGTRTRTASENDDDDDAVYPP